MTVISSKEVMKYKNFNEWYDDDPKHQRRNLGQYIKELMLDAWCAAVENYPENEQNAAIGEKVREKLNTISMSEKIDCTCDKNQIKAGLRCGCQRGKAVGQAGVELGKYLFKLRKELNENLN